MLTKLRRLRRDRTARPDGMTQPGELQIEILPSLPRVIPFDSLEAWTTRKDAYQPTTSPEAPVPDN